jgi:hypothetical protein
VTKKRLLKILYNNPGQCQPIHDTWTIKKREALINAGKTWGSYNIAMLETGCRIELNLALIG